MAVIRKIIIVLALISIGRFIRISTPLAGFHPGRRQGKRVRLPADPAWRPGASGQASVVIRRSNLAGALWWAVRKRVRSDLLL